MKSQLILKTTLLIFAPLLWLSCSSWEEVTAPDEFKPLKLTSIAPMTAKTGDTIVITGENFIKNKEYNQVWFGGNIRGIIDSATATKLFLKVPDGAQTGNVSVSNGMYADTLKSTFTVVKESPFKTASLSFGGLTSKESSVSWYYVNGNLTNDQTQYKVNISLPTNVIVKSKAPSRSTLSASNCFYNIHELPFPDSVFQSYSFDRKNNSEYNERYFGVKYTVDSTLLLVTSLYLIVVNFDNYAGSEGRINDCMQYRFTLENVPYSLVGKKIHISADYSQLLKSLKSYSYNRRQVTYPYYGQRSTSIDKDRNSIYEILPDAYFELTLE